MRQHSRLNGDFIREKIKAISWARPAARFLERITYYRRCYSVCKWETELPDQAEEELTRSGFIARLGTPVDLDRLERRDTWRSCDLYRKWLNDGRQLVLLEKNDEIMSYAWLDFSSEFVIEQVPEIRFRIASDTYFADEAYTPVAYRGLGLRRLCFIAEMLLARRKGYRHMICYFLTERAKADAFRNYLRIGNISGKIISEVHLMQIVGFRFFWVKELVKDKTLVKI
jgi:hypothetical protein